MRRHRGGTRRENGQVRFPFPDQPQLVLLDRFADLVVRNLGIWRWRFPGLECRLLLFPPGIVPLGEHRVVAMAIDDQRHVARLLCSRSRTASLASSPLDGAVPRPPISRCRVIVAWV